MARVARVHGTSGGAICGSMLLSCPDRFDDAVAHFESGRWLAGATPADVLAPHATLLRRAVRDLELRIASSELRGRFHAHVTEFGRARRFAETHAPPTWPNAFDVLPGGAAMRNVAVGDFRDDEEVIAAISASCCLSPGGVRFRDALYFDGGFSDPLPSDATLPTVAVSILSGVDVEICPESSSSSLGTTLNDDGRPFRPHGEETTTTTTVAAASSSAASSSSSEEDEGSDVVVPRGGPGPRWGALTVVPSAASKRRWARGLNRLRRYAASPANARAILDACFLTAHRARFRYDQGQRDAAAFLDHYWHHGVLVRPPSGVVRNHATAAGSGR